MYPPPPGQPPGYPPPPGQPPGYGYPPGYPPQGGGYYAYVPVPQQPQRSGLPRTLGVLAIVFCVFGLLGSLIWTFGPLDDVEKYRDSKLDPIKTWLYVWMLVSFAIFIVELVGGIMAVQYKASGLKLITWYAIIAIGLIVLDVVLVNVLIPSEYRDTPSYMRDQDGVWFSVRTMHLVYSGLALPWPIVALALSRSQKAKEACGAGGVTAQQVAQVF